ncbi:MAG: hypothetical protein NE330_06285, partial [Lentisphaeraceae bacterium]|nr:hypothetical protein [Lentisphaeraceae bacterium]
MLKKMLLLMLMSGTLFAQEENLQLFKSTKLVLAEGLSGKYGDKVKGKGAWTLIDGVLTGKPTEGQMHGPAAYIMQECTDGVIQFEFRIEDGKNCQLVLDDAKENDHKLRLVFFKEGRCIVIAGSQKGKTLRNAGKVQKYPTLSSTEWAKVTLEYLGPKIVVHLNGKIIF